MRSLARAVWYAAVRAVHGYTRLVIRYPALAWVTEFVIVAAMILAVIRAIG